MPETPSPDPLGTPLAKAPGVSPALAKALDEGFGYQTVRDLIEHYPRRYLTRGELTDLAHAKKGAEPGRFQNCSTGKVHVLSIIVHG